jgi:para-aminobenzoate synthetase component II
MYLIVDNHDSMCVAHLSQILKARALPFEVLDRSASFDLVDQRSLQGVFLSGGDNLDVTEPLLLEAIRLNSACLTSLAVPIFGICMGFEIILSLFGGILADAPTPPPSRPVDVNVRERKGIFFDLPPTLRVMEFNSLRAVAAPTTLAIVASSDRSAIEAVIHVSRPVVATQFHPEATDEAGRHSPEGLKLVNNFLTWCELDGRRPT